MFLHLYNLFLPVGLLNSLGLADHRVLLVQGLMVVLLVLLRISVDHLSRISMVDHLDHLNKAATEDLLAHRRINTADLLALLDQVDSVDLPVLLSSSNKGSMALLRLNSKVHMVVQDHRDQQDTARRRQVRCQVLHREEEMHSSKLCYSRY